jgi:hypothetical protein
MTQKNQASAEDQSRAENRVENKKPYEKPEFRYERVFETRALVCGKMTGGGPACAMNRRVS